MFQKLLTIILVLIFVSCNTKSEKPEGIIPNTINENPEEAYALMTNNCYLCHSPNAAEGDGRIAPPMVAIKARYKDKAEYSKEEFINAISAFVENPTEDKALMYGAVRKFGVMPKQAFQDSVVRKIAAFIYDYKIEEPEWFQEHWREHGDENWEQSGKDFTSKTKDKTFTDIGLEYALGTKQLLGKHLMSTIQNKGTEEALTFCNEKAIHLTDSMSVNYKAKIKRVSDKSRNPNNKANTEELKYITQYKNAINENVEPKPIVVENENEVHFYYPITTNTMCLQCHGKKEDIQPKVLAKINQLYPDDLATGYGENEVRGIWSIAFKK